MNRTHELITDQDLEAYVDGEVHGARRKAIAHRLETNARARLRVDALSNLNSNLVTMRARIYRDPELVDALRLVLSQRAA